MNKTVSLDLHLLFLLCVVVLVPTRFFWACLIPNEISLLIHFMYNSYAIAKFVDFSSNLPPSMLRMFLSRLIVCWHPKSFRFNERSTRRRFCFLYSEFTFLHVIKSVLRSYLRSWNTQTRKTMFNNESCIGRVIERCLRNSNRNIVSQYKSSFLKREYSE